MTVFRHDKPDNTIIGRCPDCGDSNTLGHYCEGKKDRIRQLNEVVKKWGDGGCPVCAERETLFNGVVELLTEIVEECRSYEERTGGKVTWCDKADGLLKEYMRTKP